MDYAAAYNRVARYSTADLRRLLKQAREDPYDHTLHGAVADALDEAHPGHPVAALIREQFGLHGGDGRDNLYHDPFYNAWDGTFPYAARLGRHGPFDLYLAHESPPYQPPSLAPGRLNHSSENARWVLHAVSNQPGSRDSGYTFEFPHAEAHRVPRLFPAAAEHIDPEDKLQYVHDHVNGGQMLVPRWQHRAIEANRFDDAMDAEERNRE